MSVSYSDELTARFCPRCYAIPCRCSRLTLTLEWAARALRALCDRRHTTRQQELR